MTIEELFAEIRQRYIDAGEMNPRVSVDIDLAETRCNEVIAAAVRSLIEKSLHEMVGMLGTSDVTLEDCKARFASGGFLKFAGDPTPIVGHNIEQIIPRKPKP